MLYILNAVQEIFTGVFHGTWYHVQNIWACSAQASLVQAFSTQVSVQYSLEQASASGASPALIKGTNPDNLLPLLPASKTFTAVQHTPCTFVFTVPPN